MNKLKCIRIWFLILSLASPWYVNGFSVLTHEALIDAAWEKSILPLLLKKYPGSSADQIKQARAYVYGGAVAPDMGYYPFGSALYTDLVHYSRSGDFVEMLLKEANNLNEFAFAVGFLCHYNADNYGHPMATNRSVPLVYPREKKKFGNEVTYAEDKISHMRMEFGFDVLQTARGNYATQGYHDYIGFKVDTSVLCRAFLKTYGLDLQAIFGHHLQLSVETFRWTINNVFPIITRAAWAAKKGDILKENPTATSKSFSWKMHKKEYNKEFGSGYKRPGIFATAFSFFVRVLPKVGPARSLKFKTPTPQAEKYFIQSFDTVLVHYALDLNELKYEKIGLADLDFDTGKKTAACEYPLADDTYNKLLLKLDKEHFKNINAPIKQNIITYYGVRNIGNTAKMSRKCRRLADALKDLQSFNSFN